MRSEVLLASALLVGACGSDWRTDMWYQPSVRSGTAPRPEPSRSVPLTAPPVVLVDRDDTEDLKNPVAPSAASLTHGASLFAARCQCCHGADGHGGGPVSKLFPPAPDLGYSVVRERSDGYVFGTITFGGRAMPALAEGLDDRDRWDLVNYVRRIQGPRPGGTR